MVEWLAQSKEHRARYLTLDEGGVVAAAVDDPAGFLAGLERPVVLDEVQKAPGLFPAIKIAVDRARVPGSFLLTGSANVLLVPRVSESLAGRMEVVKLMPFSQGEIEGRVEGFIDAVFAERVPTTKLPFETREGLAARVLRGGYPEVVARRDASRRSAWFASYIDTILQRDVRDIAQIDGLTMLPRLLALVASRASGLLNVSDIARLADIPSSTLRRYLALLEMTFLVQTIPAWSANLRTRIVKSPKVMMSDSGLLAHLQGASVERLRERPDTFGPLLENFAAMELLKQTSWSERAVGLFHFRSHAGHEVDLVLEDSAGDLVGVEIKAGATVTGSDFKGLRYLEGALGQRFRRGIVLYTGRESIPFGERQMALPIAALWWLKSKRAR